nr:hypothetical protein [Tanacetum cinerariifolium]
MMVRLQPADNDSEAKPTYDSNFVNEPISVDDQIDSNIMSDDPYVEVNGAQVKHVHDVHDQKFDDFESLIDNVKIEADNQRMVNKKMKRKNALLPKELEIYKKRIRDFENKPINNKKN